MQMKKFITITSGTNGFHYNKKRKRWVATMTELITDGIYRDVSRDFKEEDDAIRCRVEWDEANNCFLTPNGVHNKEKCLMKSLS